MMQSITVRSHVGEDGVLRLQLPVDVVNADVEVVVVFSPLNGNKGSKQARPTPQEAQGWQTDYFEDTYGSLRDDPAEVA